MFSNFGGYFEYGNGLSVANNHFLADNLNMVTNILLQLATGIPSQNDNNERHGNDAHMCNGLPVTNRNEFPVTICNGCSIALCNVICRYTTVANSNGS